MKNVICIKWGTLYGPEYVNTLYAMVKRNITPPFRFVCITDDSTGIHQAIETKPLLDDGPKGWWQKITYFKDPLYDLEGPILALDLDLLILDNIDCLFEYKPKSFCMKPDHVKHGHSSCVMRFEANSQPHIYNNLDLNNMEHSIDNVSKDFKKAKYWGDQIWITEQAKNVILWDSKWVIRYKQCFPSDDDWIKRIGFKRPPDCKIAAFAGNHQRAERELRVINDIWHTRDIDK